MTEQLNYEGLQVAKDQKASHLGGNIVEGDPFTFSPKVWQYIISRFAIQSVLDLGSGLGYAADYFFQKGLKVVAVDGLIPNIQKALYPTVQIDLTQQSVNCKVDLVHCQELVEHIDERFLKNVLRSLTCGRIILLTHALPGQPGHNHVNKQYPEYWINHLKSCGCELLEEDTDRIRKIAQAEGATYLAKTGLIFANRSHFTV